MRYRGSIMDGSVPKVWARVTSPGILQSAIYGDLECDTYPGSGTEYTYKQGTICSR